MWWEITIVADTNDADYIRKVSKISDKDLNKIKPVIEAIKNFKPYTVQVNGRPWTHSHNYTTGEVTRGDLGEKSGRECYPFDDDLFELFEEFVPFDERGIHTIESVEITPFVKKTKLL